MYNPFFCFFVLESNMEKQQLEVSKDQILCVKVRKSYMRQATKEDGSRQIEAWKKASKNIRSTF